ncbi:retrovirus-related pol polyprotein from transposon TNT 1-94 [Tanacetum coccineum]
MLPSTRRVSSTNASGSKPKSNTKNDRILQPSSRSMKNKVESHHRKFKSSANKNNHISDCNANVKNLALSKNSDTICLSCNECLFSANYDACIVQYFKKMQKHKVAKSTKQKVKSERKPTGWIFKLVGLKWIPTGRTFNLIVEMFLWYLDSGCSKHMTGHRDKLINFVSKFIGMVRFGNNHFAAIMGYGDLQMGNILISRVYYVQGLGHNLFSVGYDEVFSNLSTLQNLKDKILMASKQHGSRPNLHCLTSGHISSGLVLNQVASTSAKPLIKNDWDLLFQPMFDEYFKSPSVVSTPISTATLLPSDTARASSSSSYTSIDKDAPSLSTSPNIEATNSPLNSTTVELNEEVAMFDSDTFTNLFAPPDTSSAESSLRIVDTSNMHTFQQPPIYTKRWTKDHPLVAIIGNPSKPVSTRRQLSIDDLWCYFHALLVKVELKNYKEVMEESCWIEAMQEEIHEFERIEVWELVPRPDKAMIISIKWIFKVKLDEYGVVLKNKARLVAKEYGSILYGCEDGISEQDLKGRGVLSKHLKMSMMGQISFFLGLQISQSPRGIFINQSKYALEMLKKYGFEKCDYVDIPMVGQSKLDEDPNGTPVDPTHYRGMIRSLMYLTASRPDLVFAVFMCARYKEKPIGKHLTAVKQVFWYLKGTINMDLWYPRDTAFNLTTFADADHADYQLADIFSNAFARERIEFLIKYLGMQSITQEGLKRLAKSGEE